MSDGHVKEDIVEYLRACSEKQINTAEIISVNTLVNEHFLGV